LLSAAQEFDNAPSVEPNQREEQRRRSDRKRQDTWDASSPKTSPNFRPHEFRFFSDVRPYPGNLPSERKGRVEHWCQGVSAGLSVPAPFGWRCLTSPGMPRTPAPPHRTVRAVLPHTALRSPSATGMHGPPARSAQRPSRHRGHPGSVEEGSQPRGNPLVGIPVSGGVKVRPLPSAEVVLSSASKRYYAPLRLPTRPGAISATPYTRPLSVLAHPAGSPVVPSGAVRACHPCYPGGPPVT